MLYNLITLLMILFYMGVLITVYYGGIWMAHLMINNIRDWCHRKA